MAKIIQLKIMEDNVSSSLEDRPLKRALGDVNKCVFGCFMVQLMPIPLLHKAMVLSKYNFYLPRDSRVCIEHLDTDDWRAVVDSSTLTDFNEVHAADIVKIYKSVLVLLEVTASSALH